MHSQFRDLERRRRDPTPTTVVFFDVLSKLSRDVVFASFYGISHVSVVDVDNLHGKADTMYTYLCHCLRINMVIIIRYSCNTVSRNNNNDMTTYKVPFSA